MSTDLFDRFYNGNYKKTSGGSYYVINQDECSILLSRRLSSVVGIAFPRIKLSLWNTSSGGIGFRRWYNKVGIDKLMRIPTMIFKGSFADSGVIGVNEDFIYLRIANTPIVICNKSFFEPFAHTEIAFSMKSVIRPYGFVVPHNLELNHIKEYLLSNEGKFHTGTWLVDKGDCPPPIKVVTFPPTSSITNMSQLIRETKYASLMSSKHEWFKEIQDFVKENSTYTDTEGIFQKSTIRYLDYKVLLGDSHYSKDGVTLLEKFGRWLTVKFPEYDVFTL